MVGVLSLSVAALSTVHVCPSCASFLCSGSAFLRWIAWVSVLCFTCVFSEFACLQIPSQALILVNPVVFGALIFAVLGPTVFSFTALSYSSKKLKPSVNSAYITLQPVLVAVLSLLLFGDGLSTPEIESGCVVLAGLYLTVIGNPTVDRAWREYVSDLGTNVPQTIENVADAAVTATENVAESVAGTVVEVQESVAETVTDMKERMEFIVADASDSLEHRSNIAVRQLEELTSVKDKK